MKAASETWKMEEDGSMVARDDKGNIVYGKNGKPITESEWLENLPDNSEYQHYFDFPQGSGARPGSNGNASRVMTKQQFQDAMSTGTDDEVNKLLSARASKELRITD
jgi:hypothetical protein